MIIDNKINYEEFCTENYPDSYEIRVSMHSPEKSESFFEGYTSITLIDEDEYIFGVEFPTFAAARRAVNKVQGHPAIILIPNNSECENKKQFEDNVDEEDNNDTSRADEENNNVLEQEPIKGEKRNSTSLPPDRLLKHRMSLEALKINRLANVESEGWDQSSSAENCKSDGDVESSPDKLSSASTPESGVKPLEDVSNAGSDLSSDEQDCETDRELSEELNRLSIAENGRSSTSEADQHSEKDPSPVADAVEVLVADIHPELSTAYILHLFDSFCPIAVSYMQCLKKPRVRFCFMYFKCLEDATAAEEKFDNSKLMGKKLIVIRTQKLCEEDFGEKN